MKNTKRTTSPPLNEATSHKEFWAANFFKKKNPETRHPENKTRLEIFSATDPKRRPRAYPGEGKPDPQTHTRT